MVYSKIFPVNDAAVFEQVNTAAVGEVPYRPPGLTAYDHTIARAVVVLAGSAAMSWSSCHPAGAVNVAVPSLHSSRADSIDPARDTALPPWSNHRDSTPDAAAWFSDPCRSVNADDVPVGADGRVPCATTFDRTRRSAGPRRPPQRGRRR